MATARAAGCARSSSPAASWAPPAAQRSRGACPPRGAWLRSTSAATRWAMKACGACRWRWRGCCSRPRPLAAGARREGSRALHGRPPRPEAAPLEGLRLRRALREHRRQAQEPMRAPQQEHMRSRPEPPAARMRAARCQSCILMGTPWGPRARARCAQACAAARSWPCSPSRGTRLALRGCERWGRCCRDARSCVSRAAAAARRAPGSWPGRCGSRAAPLRAWTTAATRWERTARAALRVRSQPTSPWPTRAAAQRAAARRATCGTAWDEERMPSHGMLRRLEQRRARRAQRLAPLTELQALRRAGRAMRGRRRRMLSCGMLRLSYGMLRLSYGMLRLSYGMLSRALRQRRAAFGTRALGIQRTVFVSWSWAGTQLARAAHGRAAALASTRTNGLRAADCGSFLLPWLMPWWPLRRDGGGRCTAGGTQAPTGGRNNKKKKKKKKNKKKSGG